MPSRLPECAGWWSEPVVVFPAPGGLAFYEVIAASLPREAVPTADRRQPDPFARPHGFLHVVLSPVVCWGRSRPLRLGETAFFLRRFQSFTRAARPFLYVGARSSTPIRAVWPPCVHLCDRVADLRLARVGGLGLCRVRGVTVLRTF